jgi:hypothetical protein
VSKRKRKKPPDNADHGPAERLQHGTYVPVETRIAGVVAIRNVTVDPISTYHRRGSITNPQFLAADHFAAKFRQAQLTAAYAKMRFNDLPLGEPGTNALDAMQAAKQHVRNALGFVGFPLAKILEHVVGHCQTAGSWDGVNNSNRREQDGMAALRLALDGLKTYYRL